MDVYTSHWRAVYDHAKILSGATSNPPVPGFGYLPVRISRRGPRYWSNASVFPVLMDLAPESWMMGGYKKWVEELGQEAGDEKFMKCYRHKLHTIGLETITDQFVRLTEEYNRPLVLLCFEHDEKDCHRGHNGGFTSWWEKKTGGSISDIGLDELFNLEPITA